jgi:hypothetical protein
MEIQRESNLDKVSFSFRIKITHKKYESIKNYLDSCFDYQSNLKNKYVIIIIDVENLINYNSILSMIEIYKLKSKDFDIYIDIISSYDFGGITMPLNIVELIRQLNCDLHFSYVVC